ncbi:hypothetical protein N9N28_15430 [Rubripirellula amarantea]|nr:hypothetical protein [Rubripirellula amarantea]
MFEQLGTFDQAFPSPSGSSTAISPPLKRRRPWGEVVVFWGANLFVLPIVGTIYATIIAEGLRRLMPIFQLRLYKLPIPGAGLARQYDGFDRLDTAIVMSLLLFVLVTWIWNRIFTELLGFGTIMQRRSQAPIVFGLLSFVAFVILAGDALIFYVGLSSQSSSGWSETPSYVAPVATLIYSCGLAILGWWHSDYQHSNLV